MKIVSAPFRLLSSKAVLLWIIGGWIVYYVMSAIWEKEAFGSFIAQLGNNPLFQVPFILFLLCGFANAVRASVEIWKKSRPQFFAWILLPFGVLVFLTGFFLSVTSRQAGQIFVGKGDMVKPPWSSTGFMITGLDPGLKKRLSDADIHQGLFSYQPTLTLSDRSSRQYRVGAFPPAKIEETYYHILNFGIAPEIRLLQNSRVWKEGFMILRILAPGSSDFFDVLPLPYRFVVSLDTERTAETGTSTSSEFSLTDLFYSITVYKGDTIIAEGNSKMDIRFEDFSLRFFKSTFWIQLEAVKDHGIPILHAGLILVLFGLPLFLVKLGFNIIKSG